MWNFLRFAWFYLDLLDFDGIWWILKDFDRFPMVFRRFALVFPLQKSPQRPETVSNALKPSCTHLGCQGMRLEGASGPFRPWKAQIWHSEHFIFRLSLLLMSTTVGLLALKRTYLPKTMLTSRTRSVEVFLDIHWHTLLKFQGYTAILSMGHFVIRYL